jgi:hypothetical protein
MWVGLCAALIALGLGGLQVVRSLVVPIGISRSLVLGIGLAALVAFAFLMTWRRQVVGIASSVRISTVSFVGTILAVILIGMYVLVTNNLFNFVRVSPEEWARYTDLRNGLEALAFGAAGALLGATLQKQAADRAAARADDNARTAAANYLLAQRAIDLAERPALPVRRDEDGTPITDDGRSAQIEDLRERLQLPR